MLLFALPQQCSDNEEDDFSLALRAKSSPRRAAFLRKFFSKGKTAAASVGLVPKKSDDSSSQESLRESSEDHPDDCDGSTTDGTDYVRTSDCLLLDGLVDQYLGAQRQHRRAKADYNINYFRAAEAAAAWPEPRDEMISEFETPMSRGTTTTSSDSSDATTSSSYEISQSGRKMKIVSL
eukprot:TRINITY_DN62497_c0_g1_i1.p1 TRINITY_DN62497_c0_g1~~TRINITY_DN62497_c0_g1_i1.p1  ORF type:complete len:179 (+),score=43.42 TRINITY_DN62497_c0_g1_i1:177-713(+)